jgi:hypothetical protein
VRHGGVASLRGLGDDANYLLVPGGSLEAGTPAWALSRGAYVGPGNEPFRTEGDGGTRSLYLLPGSTAMSRTACFKFGDWHARFFVRGIGPRGGRLEVDVVVKSLLGVLTVLDGGSVETGSARTLTGDAALAARR